MATAGAGIAYGDMTMIARGIAVLSIAVGLGAAPAAASAASPTAVLTGFFERANAVIRAADPGHDMEEPRRAIRGLISEVFDFRDAASVAIGPLWRSRSPREQEEFIRLFADLLERGYLAVFSSKASLSGGVIVQYLAESIAGEWAMVPTRVRTRTGEELPVEYRLARREERWTVRDVIVDGVSLVGNYRAQFSRILGTSSFPDLLARMRGGEPVVPALAAAGVPATAGAPTPAGGTPAPAGGTVDPAASVPPREPQLTAVLTLAPAGAPATAAARPDASPATRQPPPAEPAPIPPAKAEPAQVQPAKAEPVARARYWVQLGAFKTLEAARNLVSALRPQPASISTGPAPAAADTTLNRVRVGPFDDHGQATAKLIELDARGYPGFVALTSD